MANRWPRVGVLIALVLPLNACIMIPGPGEIRGLSGSDGVQVSPVPVALALRAQVFEDGIHARAEEYGEEYVHRRVLHATLLRAGILGKAAPKPSADTLNLLVEVEEDRTGPRGLRVLSTVTLRVIPNWTTVHYRVRARGMYRGRPIPAFEYENTATRIENLLLFPAAPFVTPQSARARIRGEAMRALAVHLSHALAGGAPSGPGGGGR
jgi:hypothetical protein